MHQCFREMDPLSITASVIAILQLTNSVVGYLNEVKDAPRECQECTVEASSLQSLLTNLRYRLEQSHAGDPWYTAVRALNIENGPLDQYKKTLEQLRTRVDVKDEVKKLKRRLVWKFSKAEVAGILGRMERLKSLVIIALENDLL